MIARFFRSCSCPALSRQRRPERARWGLKTDVQPLEFTGRAGDTNFCRGWVVHSAGIHETDRTRLAAIQDFNKDRKRSHMRWTAAGKNGGPRINCDTDGVFRFGEGSHDDPADGYRGVIMDSNEFVLSREATIGCVRSASPG